jgi:hypothetical protein
MNKSLKEEAEKLLQIKGMTKGSEILTLAHYIESKHGKKEVWTLERKLEELGCPIHFNEIEPAIWYPESWIVLGMIVAKELFDWKDLYDIGYNSPVFSFGVRVFMKFLPLKAFVTQIPGYWRKFLDFGEIEGLISTEEKNCGTVRLKNYMFHPDMCLYFAGFFLRLAEYVIKSKKITIKETKCIYKGDSYHEYVFKWL